MDLEELDFRLANLKLLGSKGTTGTQASFMELFEGDSTKVKKLEQMIAEEMGFTGVVPVSGQTYSRKIDSQILATLSGIAQSCSKFSNDMRLLQSFKEMEEPFEKTQIGSSAMAYKRNPMRCERITSLSRYVMIDSLNPAFTAGTQWFERTLDDSANKRISVPEACLGVDAILNIMLNVTDGLVVYPKMIRQRIMRELPFMATENIMMDAVKKGGVMASSYVGGLSGAFIPVSEDQGMIDAVNAGSLTLEKLEAMTCVCSVGLDMIAIPGDTKAETISGIIADEMAIGMINQKTTAVRLIPVIGKDVGDTVEFGGLLGYAPIMPVNSFSCDEFVNRGGRIPAPIHSFKN